MAEEEDGYMDEVERAQRIYSIDRTQLLALQPGAGLAPSPPTRVIVIGPLDGDEPIPDPAILQDSLPPVIVVLDGACNADAFRLALRADFVAATTRTTFRAGTSPSWTDQDVALLARRLPLGTATRIVMTPHHAWLSAEEAHRRGLLVITGANRESVMDDVKELAAQVARSSPDAVWWSRRLLWRSLEMPMGQALRLGGPILREFYGHPDSVEGPLAFVGRRSPNWTPSDRQFLAQRWDAVVIPSPDV